MTGNLQDHGIPQDPSTCVFLGDLGATLPSNELLSNCHRDHRHFAPQKIPAGWRLLPIGLLGCNGMRTFGLMACPVTGHDSRFAE